MVASWITVSFCSEYFSISAFHWCTNWFGHNTSVALLAKYGDVSRSFRLSGLGLDRIRPITIAITNEHVDYEINIWQSGVTFNSLSKAHLISDHSSFWLVSQIVLRCVFQQHELASSGSTIEEDASGLRWNQRRDWKAFVTFFLDVDHPVDRFNLILVQCHIDNFFRLLSDDRKYLPNLIGQSNNVNSKIQKVLQWAWKCRLDWRALGGTHGVRRLGSLATLSRYEE